MASPLQSLDEGKDQKMEQNHGDTTPSASSGSFMKPTEMETMESLDVNNQETVVLCPENLYSAQVEARLLKTMMDLGPYIIEPEPLQHMPTGNEPLSRKKRRVSETLHMKLQVLKIYEYQYKREARNMLGMQVPQKIIDDKQEKYKNGVRFLRAVDPLQIASFRRIFWHHGDRLNAGNFIEKMMRKVKASEAKPASSTSSAAGREPASEKNGMASNVTNGGETRVPPASPPEDSSKIGERAEPAILNFLLDKPCVNKAVTFANRSLNGGQKEPGPSGGQEEPGASGRQDEPGPSGGQEEPGASGRQDEPGPSGGQEEPGPSSGQEEPGASGVEQDSARNKQTENAKGKETNSDSVLLKMLKGDITFYRSA